MSVGSRVLSLMVGSLLVISCSGSGAAQTGTIQGLLAAFGSATHGQFVPLPGTVTATANGKSYRVTVGRDGKYTLHLPPGTYTLRGTSPQYNHGAIDACHATGKVPVARKQVITAGVLCLAQGDSSSKK